MRIEMSGFDEDDFKRAIINAARERAESHMLDIAEQVRAEMGSAGQGLRFDFDTARGSHTDELGELRVSGATEEARQDFARRLHERMGH